MRVVKNMFVIEMCPLLGGNLKKNVTFGTKRFVRYSWHVRCLGCPLLGGIIVLVKFFGDTLQKLIFLYFCKICRKLDLIPN